MWVTLLLWALSAPSPQTLIYYNARAALREGRAEEALKLWLLRNTLAAERGLVSAHDGDLRSTTWAALGVLGLCPDGLTRDDLSHGGAGLWPIAAHNIIARAHRSPPPPSAPDLFSAFDYGRQQRGVSLHDVLDLEELRAVRFQRGGCWLATRLLIETRQRPWAELRDKAVTARLLRYLLRGAARTIDPARVRGGAVLKARVFDLNVRLLDIKARQARREAQQARWALKRAGLPAPPSGPPPIDPDTEDGQLLTEALSWPATAWMDLSPARRQALFAQAIAQGAEPSPALLLGVIDRLIERRAGVELHSWLAYLGVDPARRRQAWAGERGRRLLTLDGESGFRGRGVIALHRGIDHLGAGARGEALRDLAHALRWSEGGLAGEATRDLSRRWLSFVAAQVRVDDALLAALQAIAPRGDLNAILEDQLWHAAFAADAESFERCAAARRGRGALGRRLEALRPLSRGDAEGFLSALIARRSEAPSDAAQLIRRFVERLQAQDRQTRARYAPTLRAMSDLLIGGEGREAELRAQIEDTLSGLGLGEVAARAATPTRAVFVGSLRLAPSDLPPWPFQIAEVDTPSVFTPLTLRPEAWRGHDGAWILGWRIVD